MGRGWGSCIIPAERLRAKFSLPVRQRHKGAGRFQTVPQPRWGTALHTRAPEPQPQPRGAGGEEEGLGPTQVRAAVAPASGVRGVGGHGSRGWHTTSWSLEEGSLPGPCGRKAGSLQGPPPPKRLQGPVRKPARKDRKENGITFKGTEAGGQTHSPCFLDLQQDAPSLVQRAAAERKSGELNPRQTHSPRPSARDRPGPRSPALLQALTTPRQVTPTAPGPSGRI